MVARWRERKSGARERIINKARTGWEGREILRETE